MTCAVFLRVMIMVCKNNLGMQDEGKGGAIADDDEREKSIRLKGEKRAYQQ